MNETKNDSPEGKRIGARMIPLDHLRAHPLNSNVMPEDLREKLRAHIHRTGRYPFLVVRPHPDEPACFEVLAWRCITAPPRPSATCR